MEVYGYVYMVRNKVNGKIYFGITENDFDTRYSRGIEHTHNEHLQSSIKKYGIENFEINKEFDIAYNEDDLYDLEDMYICLYNTMNDKYGYNKRRSGKEHKGHGKMSEESKHRVSEKTKEALSNPETKQKQSQGTKEALNRPEIKQKMRNAQKGRKHTEETKQKISESRKGEKNPMYGKQFSEEHKRKIREAQKSKKVCQYDLDGNYIQTFISVSEAQRQVGIKSGIGKCCEGKTKQAGGYKWKYAEENIKESEAI